MKKGIDKKGWKKITFGEMCKNITISERDPLMNGIDRYVGLEHIETNNLHITNWGNVTEGTTFTKKFKKGQVLFGKRRAYLRKVALADFDGVCSGDILVFEANKNKIDSGLLPFIVSSDRFFDHAIQTSAGSLSPRTKFQDLAELEFTIPPRNEQTKLAELLLAADITVNHYQKLVDKLARIRERIVHIEYQGVSEFIRLGDLGIISYGMGVPPSLTENATPIIRATNIHLGEIFEKDMIAANPEDISVAKRIFLKEGDIIVVRSGAYTGDIGYINRKWEGALAGYDLIFSPERSKTNPIFIREILLSGKIQTYFKNERTRSAQPHLNANQLKNTLIPNIKLEKQIQIAKRIDNVCNIQKSLESIIDNFIALKRQIINQIFS